MNLLGMLFITLSVMGGVIKGYCGKSVGTYAHTITDSAKLNFIRMVLCTAISLAVLSLQGNFMKLFTVSPVALIISLCAATASTIFIISWLMAVRGSAYMLVSVFTNLGVIVPIVLSALFFGDPIGINQILGLLILLVAIWLMLGYNKGLGGGLKVKDVILLTVCSIANGVCDFFIGSTARLGESLGTAFGITDISVDKTVFNFYMYLFSFIILFAFTGISSVAHHKAEIKITGKILRYMVLMAIFLFVNTYFKSLAGGLLTSSQLFSFNTGGGLVLATLMASIMFREKPTLKSIIGIILTFVALFVLKS